MMALNNITGLSPSYPVYKPIKSADVNQNEQSEVSRSYFTKGAAIFSFSSEVTGAQYGRPKGINQETGKDQSGISENKTGIQLTDAQKQVIQQLRIRDLHVKMHEQQHLAAAGSYARGGPTFTYTVGPDGKSYATGGEVQLDISPVPNNPQATITKAQTIRRAALAPSDPSGADRAVAAAASAMENQARAELSAKNLEQTGRSPEEHRSNFYVKAYQNMAKIWSTGNSFSQIA